MHLCMCRYKEKGKRKRCLTPENGRNKHVSHRHTGVSSIQTPCFLLCCEILAPLVFIDFTIPFCLPIIQAKTRVVLASANEEIRIGDGIPNRQTSGLAQCIT